MSPRRTRVVTEADRVALAVLDLYCLRFEIERAAHRIETTRRWKKANPLRQTIYERRYRRRHPERIKCFPSRGRIYPKT